MKKLRLCAAVIVLALMADRVCAAEGGELPESVTKKVTEMTAGKGKVVRGDEFATLVCVPPRKLYFQRGQTADGIT